MEQNNRNLTIPQSLVNVLQEETQHKWTDEEVKGLHLDLLKGPITSVYITPERNLHPEMMARIDRIQSESRSILASLRSPSQTPLPPSLPTTPRITPAPVAPAPAPATTQPVQEFVLPTPQPTRPVQQSSVAKLISEIAKIYTDEQKYDGSNGSFDQKLTIFLDICQRVKLPEEALIKAFPTMLKGLAQDHFYSNKLSQHTYPEACANIRNFFKGPGYNRRNLDKWNLITLATVTIENPGKTTFENI